MTDEELLRFLGLENDAGGPAYVASIPLEKRAAYEALSNLEFAVRLWEEGLGQRPDAILDYPKHIRQRGR